VITPTADIVDPLDYDKCHLDEQKKYYTLEALEVLEKRREKALEKKESREKSFAENKKLIKMAHDAGCILTTGTDQVGFSLLPGFSLWREMEIFAEAGLSPMEILKTATINGAFAIGRSDLLGSLQGGMLADFVILDMNPLENISHVRNVFKIVKGGVVYEPEKLLKPLEGKYQ